MGKPDNHVGAQRQTLSFCFDHGFSEFWFVDPFLDQLQRFRGTAFGSINQLVTPGFFQKPERILVQLHGIAAAFDIGGNIGVADGRCGLVVERIHRRDDWTADQRDLWLGVRQGFWLSFWPVSRMVVGQPMNCRLNLIRKRVGVQLCRIALTADSRNVIQHQSAWRQSFSRS